MLSPHTSSRIATFVSALALAAGAVLAPSASARAVKSAAPSLTIEAKNCSIGATDELRSATVTALALVGTTGDRVTMRFSVQSRQGKTRWKPLLFKDPGTTKKWETTEAAGAGLRLTKIFPKLPENYEYRVVIEARSVDADGKVVSKTARKYVLCKQPLFTPTLVLGKIEATKVRDVAGDGLVVPVKNLGRLPSKDYVVTVVTADTRELLVSVRWAPLKGGATNRTTVPLGVDCTGPVKITVQEEAAALETLTASQTTTVDCTGATSTTPGSG